MIWKRWIQQGVLCVLVLGGLGACSMLENPSVGQISSSDHAALAAYYEKEAASLRENAKGEMVMAETYRKNPGDSTRGVVSKKVDMITHCEALAGMYTKAAEEADQLAQVHRDFLK